MSMNIVMLVGKFYPLEKDAEKAELKTLPSGKSVITFTCAVRRAVDKEKVDYLKVVVWDKTAEFIANYATAGCDIIVEGRVETRSYTDRNGNNKVAVEVQANRVELPRGANNG